ncbi:MAG TPA: porin family protein [Gemmatimonadales bacterium]|nr:porin family protein [Gemmatimonadales bacterium]
MLAHCIRACLALSIAAVPLAGQQPHAIEVGLFGRGTHYSDDIGLDDALGIGVGAGYYFSPVLSVDADASYSTSNLGALEGSHLPVHLRLLLNLPFTDRLSLFAGTGPVLEIYGKDLSATNAGLGTTVGARIGITSQFMVRAGGTWDWMTFTEADAPSYANLGATLGVSFFPGRSGGPSAEGDEDADGVRNVDDACPGTPPGSQVDATGCVRRSDSDNDGVIDINDVCPGTPAGAKVNANGCPLAASDRK